MPKNGGPAQGDSKGTNPGSNSSTQSAPNKPSGLPIKKPERMGGGRI